MINKLMILFAAALTVTSAFADRGHRRGYGHNRDTNHPVSCSYDLEINTRGNEWRFMQEFSRYSCAAAFDACDYERMVRPNSSSYRCIPSYSRPTPPPRTNSCVYKIQDGIFTEPEVFSASGRGACAQAEAQCARVLRIKQRRNEVSHRAVCVKKGRSTPPRRGRIFKAQCTAQQYFSSNRGNNPTQNYFYGKGRGHSKRAAHRNACFNAMSKCQSVSVGRFYCVELN